MQKMNTLIDTEVNPKLGLNRHIPKAVLYGPLSRGGLNYPQFKINQTTRSITYMIKQLQWNKNIAKDMRISIEATQLMSGIERPIMENVGIMVKYMEGTWVFKVRERLRWLKASINVEHIWYQKKQLINGISIMEKVMSIQGITLSQLEITNICRIYLRVIMISDLANIIVTAIPPGQMTVQWRKESKLTWPEVRKPPPK